MKKMCVFLVVAILGGAVGSGALFAEEFFGEDIGFESRSIAQTRGSKKRVRTRRGREAWRRVIRWIQEERYEEASRQLFALSRHPEFIGERIRIKYTLGRVFSKMGFHQAAAFHFVSVIRSQNKNYLVKSLERLSETADQLGDDTLINYALKKVDLKIFPKSYLSSLYFRIGEQKLKNKDYKGAVRSLRKVKRGSPIFGKAKYLEGLAFAELQENRKALSAFEELLLYGDGKGVTDPTRVAALIGKARVYYQSKKWSKAIETYRLIPRDTWAWHDTLFESSWAMLRSGKFRSALSNFQSLHSSFYKDYYYPESLLLRSIVYLYICKYDEMEKVLAHFNQAYKPVYKSLDRYLKGNVSYMAAYKEAAQVSSDFHRSPSKKFEIHYMALRQVVRSGDFQQKHLYVQNLQKELRNLKGRSSAWRKSSVGKYVKRVLGRRISKARKRAGREALFQLRNIKQNLFNLFEQEAFIKYEMTNGKKEFLKKRVSGKELPRTTVDQDRNRDYYIQNGYEYWKFQGEYWLDEIGNYHYVGTHNCE